MAIDPVCGMDVNPDTAEHSMEYKGQMYYFCSLGCKLQFEQEPEAYLTPGLTPPQDPSL